MEGSEIIVSYTREEAIKDGVLIDVSETAKEAGIRFPTVVTRNVWNKYVHVPEGVIGQDDKGRLWDIVWMLRNKIIHTHEEKDSILFGLYVRNDNIRPKYITLKAVSHPGDNGEPVMTIMLPDED